MKKNNPTATRALKSLHPLFASIILTLTLTLSSNQASAQVEYGNGNPWQQRATHGPDAEVPGWYYNLGVTGLRAELVSDQPKALVIRHIFNNTPGANIIKVGDIITGAGGKAFVNPHRNGYGEAVFGGHGPVSEMAQALEECQGPNGNGQLQLELIRNGSKMNVNLQIGKTYGTYSPTYPFNCPKSQKILDELLEYIVSQQADNGSFGDPVQNTFSTLALLGSGDSKYIPAIEKNLTYIIEIIGDGRERGLVNWEYMGAAITLSEYYLITKKDWVIPHLNKMHTLIKNSQYMNVSQIDPKVMETHPDDFPRTDQEKIGGWGQNTGFEGYGPISMITAQGALSYTLLQRCGIEIDKNRLNAAYEFLKRGTAANGYVWYEDKLGGGPTNWADMGRTGASGIANFLSPFPTDLTRNQAIMNSNVIGTHPESFPDTHGSPIMGMAYAALAANTNPLNFRKLMDSNRWWFTMAQCNDETFYFQPNRDNAGYGSDARMTASCVVAFIYTIKNKNLIITGRTNATNPTDPVIPPSSNGLTAEFFDFNSNLTQLPDLTDKTPDLVRVDATINYQSTNAQWEGLPTSMIDSFASRHTGLIEIKQSGNYTFYLSSDDGSKLWIKDQLTIDNDGVHGMVELSSTIFLTAGFHPIRVEFFENSGGAGLTLKWAGPSIPKQIIASTSLSQGPNSEGGNFIPGLWYGTVAGNINTTDPNPKTTITTTLAETEDSINDDTTEIYTGQIFDADGNISFSEFIDDNTRLYIDGTLVLTDDQWWVRKSTNNLKLTPGWHDFELRISNGHGGSGPVEKPGFAFDPDGGTNWIHPADPGNGTLFRTTSNINSAPAKTIKLADLKLQAHATIGTLGQYNLSHQSLGEELDNTTYYEWSTDLKNWQKLDGTSVSRDGTSVSKNVTISNNKVNISANSNSNLPKIFFRAGNNNLTE